MAFTATCVPCSSLEKRATADRMRDRWAFVPIQMANSNQAPVKRGDVIDGKYRVEKILGVGGMGVVVAARHIALNTLVAMKFMLPAALADAESVKRFSHEARAAVRLKSEHAARVLDVGTLKNGMPYIVMELLVGQDLGVMLEKATAFLPIQDAVDYMLQACEAIAEAHALGIIHRDLKPRNIFVTRSVDGRVLVKVLDFGLAKSIGMTGAQERGLTQTSAIMGSPQYMSPEQMRASRSVDRRTDIWSLGVCLYELLARVPPFDAPTMPELCALVLAGVPQPLQVHRPDIPVRLSQAVMRCLERDPAARFADVGELAHALEEHAHASVGSAARVRRVLDAPTEPIVDLQSHRPPPLGGETTSDTRTEATFDSKPDRTRAWTAAAVGGISFVVVGVLAGALVLLPHTLHRPPVVVEAPASPPAPPALVAAPPPAVAPERPPPREIQDAGASIQSVNAVPPKPAPASAVTKPPATKPATKLSSAPSAPKPATTAF